MDGLNRRDVLRLAAGGGLVASVSSAWWFDPAADAFAGEVRAFPAPVPAGTVGYSYFTPAEAAWVDAAVARLIPEDASGPGAVQAGVTFFIDQQLGGPYGKAVNWYMRGPFGKGTEEQGYQLERNPAQLYRAAIAAIDAHCGAQFGGKTFRQIAPADQDELLHALEKDKLKLPGVSGKAFFTMLWDNTKEGFFADPMYGGNRNFIGWRLVGFPGPRYNYVSEIRHFGQPYTMPTVGILGRDPSRRLAAR
jgi:gluconate 2-dehydrogenase gamma chain